MQFNSLGPVTLRKHPHYTIDNSRYISQNPYLVLPLPRNTNTRRMIALSLICTGMGAGSKTHGSYVPDKAISVRHLQKKGVVGLHLFFV
jgi:hypothetical protein